MSATLGVLLKELHPEVTIAIYERLDKVAAESSDAWNNAGTGHSALCELNYTPEGKDGKIDISKALKITEQFEVSRQLWSYLKKKGYFPQEGSFIHSVPHMSFVWGAENVQYLKKRYEAMKAHQYYSSMQYSEDHEQLRAWMPLVMEGRDKDQQVAATRIEIGTDVNFGMLTRSLMQHLTAQPGVSLHLQHEVHHLHKEGLEQWKVGVEDMATGTKQDVMAKFVFIGAGGGSLPLLEKSHIPESKGFGGFPVSGQWLRCTNAAITARHHAKVYGKAGVGAPPMSVPHLDTRIIDGKQELLFGPYAGFSTKFLKEGSYGDLPKSLTLSNIMPMIDAGLHNVPLTKYLIGQVMQSQEDRMKELREYYPDARNEDWELKIAGQRVQVIKKDDKEGGVLEFGTEVVCAAGGSIAALLGASPGASTSVAIMLDLMHRCFAMQMNSPAWIAKLKEMIPSYGQTLASNESLTKQVRAETNNVLDLMR